MQINNVREIKHHKLVIKNLAQNIKALDEAEELLDKQIKIYKKEKFKFHIRKCEDAKRTILSLINSLAKDINYRRGIIRTLEEEDSLKSDYFDLSETNSDRSTELIYEDEDEDQTIGDGIKRKFEL